MVGIKRFDDIQRNDIVENNIIFKQKMLPILIVLIALKTRAIRCLNLVLIISCHPLKNKYILLYFLLGFIISYSQNQNNPDLITPNIY